jgi:type IV pilus assembly protein PilY1
MHKMKKGFKVLSTVGVLTFIFSSEDALAYDPAQVVKPVVLLLLDTSGSMEYDVNAYQYETGDEDVLNVPPCEPGNYGKSRFIVALEVLTGSFIESSYQCYYDNRLSPTNREDYGYEVPHVVPVGVQLPDGLIDLARDRIKFGIMTFDVNPGAGKGAGGGYSYGPETPKNYGAKNENAPTGWFVPPSSSDDPTLVMAQNAAVESSLMSAIPYGGTPLAPILSDALYFFQTEPSLQPYDPKKKTGDFYYNCRDKRVVLITDGRANLGEGTDGYQTAVQYARQLYEQMGIKVHVVGFQLPPGVDSLMHQIAEAGGTGQAEIAIDAQSLATKLGRILGTLQTAVQSRTRLVVTNNTGNTHDRQYLFSAGYGLVPDRPGLYKGYLERTVYSCVSGSSASVTEVQSLGDKLNQKDDSLRSIWTFANGLIQQFATWNNQITLDLFGYEIPSQPGQLLLQTRSLDPVTSECKPSPYLLDMYYEEQRRQFISYLIDYVRVAPGSCRDPEKLGAIVHSTPVVQESLTNVTLSSASFNTYKSKEGIRDRPVVLYVGTHDGLLHAFRVDRASADCASPSWGDEMWAFIPPEALKSIKDLPLTFKVLADGEPVVKDILLSRTAESIRLPEQEALKWKSVLVMGMGSGGRGYFALDVTKPQEGPKFMWQITPEKRIWVDDGGFVHEQDGEFERLGYAVSKPSIGTVFTGAEEVAVAVFGGGSGEGLEPGVGRTMYVVRLDTGEKIAEFYPLASPPNVIDPCGLGETSGEPMVDMIGDVTCYSTTLGTFITRCFLGDRAGRLWRLDLGHSCVSEWRLQLFYDPYKSVSPSVPLTSEVRAPAVEAPAVAPMAYGRDFVVAYGGGDPDRIDNVTPKAFIVSLRETTDSEPSSYSCIPYTEPSCKITGIKSAMLNYKWFLGYDSNLNPIVPRPDSDEVLPSEDPQGERLLGAPLIFSNGLYFTTYAPDLANGCSPGIGWMWGVDYFQKDQTCDKAVPKLQEKVENALSFKVKERIGGPRGGSIPYGLTLANTPACFDGKPPEEALPPCQCPNCTPLSAQVPSNPTLIVQSASPSAESPETLPPSGVMPTISKTVQKFYSYVQSFVVSVWGLLFD